MKGQEGGRLEGKEEKWREEGQEGGNTERGGEGGGRLGRRSVGVGGKGERRVRGRRTCGYLCHLAGPEGLEGNRMTSAQGHCRSWSPGGGTGSAERTPTWSHKITLFPTGPCRAASQTQQGASGTHMSLLGEVVLHKENEATSQPQVDIYTDSA